MIGLQAYEVLSGFSLLLILFNPLITEKVRKIDLWDASSSTNFKHQ